ncbi:MAG: hypothetical protein AAF399_20975 [Bacteroidota bacterium]
MKNPSNRRHVLKGSAALAAGFLSAPLLTHASPPPGRDDELYLVGPKEGFSPHVGSLFSMMTMMRTWVVRRVENLSIKELDHQVDKQSNSIGAMLLHLAATERYYQLNTFYQMQWGSWSEEVKAEWDVPMVLGKMGRKQIKGHEISYYLDKLKTVRETTRQEFMKRDDVWLMESETFFDNLPTNNFAKWFHVCEHESNHLGQIKFILKRLA